MKLIKKLNKWANSHTYYPIDILRIALGVFLIIKGISFIRDSSYLEELVPGVDEYSVVMFFVHYVGMFHFVGGIMIVFGLLTRLAIAVQLPIIIGALAVNAVFVFNGTNLIQELIVFAVSIFFILYGSGKHSMDYDLKMQA